MQFGIKTWTESDVVVTQAVRSGTHSKFSQVIESFPGLARPNIRLPTVPQCPILTSLGVRAGGRGEHVSLLLNIKHYVAIMIY